MDMLDFMQAEEFLEEFPAERVIQESLVSQALTWAMQFVTDARAHAQPWYGESVVALIERIEEFANQLYRFMEKFAMYAGIHRSTSVN